MFIQKSLESPGFCIHKLGNDGQVTEDKTSRRPNRFRNRSFLSVLLLGLITFFLNHSLAEENAIEGSETSETIQILFLGNSFTYYNSLDQMVQDMFNVSDFSMKATRNAPGGWRLRQHFLGNIPNDKFKPTPELIQNEQWNFVVLQEQSAGTVNERDEFLEFGEKMNQMIKENCPTTKVLLYQTWGRHFGMFDGYAEDPSQKDVIIAAWETRYNKKANENVIENLRDGIQGGYAALAEKIDATIVPVGKAFDLVGDKINLYCDEGNQVPFHPNQAGTYLAGCVFFKTISGQSPVGLYAKLVQNGKELSFSADDAAFLENVADQIVD